MGVPNTETSTNLDVTPGYGVGKSVDGYNVGQSALDYVGFFGKVPTTQPAGLSKLTDTSGGTASASTGLQALTSSYNSGLIANGLSTLAAAVNQIYTVLNGLGLQSS